MSAPAAALVDICIDDQRHILYTRSQASVLQVGAGEGKGQHQRGPSQGAPNKA